MALHIHKDGQDDKKKNSNSRESFLGTYEDMLKKKKSQLPEIEKNIEKMFGDYDGGGVAVVMNTYDENGDVDGAKVMIAGVDKPAGLIRLAKSLHMASEEIVDGIQNNGNPQELLEALKEMMGEIFGGKNE